MSPARTLIAACVLVLASPAAFADTEVQVEINGVEKHEGSLVVRLYDSKKVWLKDAIHEASVDLDPGGTTTIVSVPMTVPPGDYAVHVYHDLDGNGKMKTNFIGIPKEPTGVEQRRKRQDGPAEIQGRRPDGRYGPDDDPDQPDEDLAGSSSG